MTTIKESPRRVQRRRTKGWRMPENTVYVGRPSKWHNPFRVGAMGFLFENGSAVFYRGDGATAANVTQLYREEIAPKLRDAARAELAGKNLACWCLPGHPCHADVLLKLANS